MVASRVIHALRALIAVLVIALVVPGPVPAQLVKAGVVTTVQGSATVTRAALRQPAPLKFKDDVFQGDRVATGDNALARLLLGGKAVVTVRERSAVTITEVPGTSTVDVTNGYVALAVAKERMKSGESIQIRTPNAVAGVRGTVVLVEVTQPTTQVGPAAGGFSTLFTLLVGTLLVNQRDAAGNPIGAGVTLGPLQQTAVTGQQPPRPPVTITLAVAQRLAATYRARLADAAPGVNSALTEAQLREAVTYLDGVVARGGDLGAPPPPPRGGASGSPYTVDWGPFRHDVIEAIKEQLVITGRGNVDRMRMPPACMGSNCPR